MDGCGMGSREERGFGNMRSYAKIFVAGVTAEGVTVDDVRHHFSQVCHFILNMFSYFEFSLAVWLT